MQSKASVILFITSFFPVAVFKVVARVGGATLNQAKLAVTIGLLLAGTQMLLSRKWAGEATYLERAFLGFLAVGTVWLFFTPHLHLFSFCGPLYRSPLPDSIPGQHPSSAFRLRPLHLHHRQKVESGSGLENSPVPDH